MTEHALRFRRCQRLLSPSAFQPLFDQPDFRVGGKSVLLLVRENHGDVARLGMVIGKRRVRKANQRNTLRRLARESFRLRQSTLVGLDIVMLIKAPIERVDKLIFTPELNRLWDKLLAKRGQA